MNDTNGPRSRWVSFFKDMSVILEVVLFLVAGALAIIGYQAGSHPPGFRELALASAAVGAALGVALHVVRRQVFPRYGHC